MTHKNIPPKLFFLCSMYLRQNIRRDKNLPLLEVLSSSWSAELLRLVVSVDFSLWVVIWIDVTIPVIANPTKILICLTVLGAVNFPMFSCCFGRLNFFLLSGFSD